MGRGGGGISSDPSTAAAGLVGGLSTAGTGFMGLMDQWRGKGGQARRVSLGRCRRDGGVGCNSKVLGRVREQGGSSGSHWSQRSTCGRDYVTPAVVVYDFSRWPRRREGGKGIFDAEIFVAERSLTLRLPR